MNKKKFRIKKRWLIGVLLVSLILSELFYFSLKRFVVDIQTLSWSKNHEDLKGTRIVFISDLHYGFSMDDAKLNELVTWINRLDADIILFGGDLFDHPSTLLP
ncbi:MAG: metallophosphoesterase [Erysipelotrichaceae bacterium]|nr:metallophosphoesterase [Erysipelotrichaceae bacterium]